MTQLRWGVLGVAGIATRKVIPAMQRGSLTEVAGIASRVRKKADDAAKTAAEATSQVLATVGHALEGFAAQAPRRGR